MRIVSKYSGVVTVDDCFEALLPFGMILNTLVIDAILYIKIRICGPIYT